MRIYTYYAIHAQPIFGDVVHVVNHRETCEKLYKNPLQCSGFLYYTECIKFQRAKNNAEGYQNDRARCVHCGVLLCGIQTV